MLPAVGVAVRLPTETHDLMGERKTVEVGDRLTSNGQEWLVVRVATGNNGSSITVTLRPLQGAPETDGA